MLAWGLSRAKRVDLEGEPVTFAPPEYVIVKQLQFYREGGSTKHLRDIQRMLIGLGEDWNREELLKHVKELKLEGEWGRVLGPPVP